MKKVTTLLCFACLFFTNKALAKKDTYTTTVNWGSGAASLAVPAPPIFSFGGLNTLSYRTKTLNSYVKLQLNTENILAGLTSFTATVDITIKYYLEDPNSSNTQPPVSTTKQLVVNYDAVAGHKYKNVAVENFPNASKIEVTINSFLVNGAAPSSIHQQFIALQLCIEHERYYNYQNIFGNDMQMPMLPVPTASYDQINNELSISWSPERHAEGYELEYTFVDDYSNGSLTSFIPPSQLYFTFQHNSTRILVEGTSYTMPLVQEHGYLLFRVRGYGMAGPDFNKVFFGTYIADVSGDQTFTVATYPYQYAVNVLKHVGDSINWQSVTTFAEEGKNKTVVSYMDGTLRTRQTVTSNSTEKNAIVAETIYDFQGRAAVNVLPTPVNNSIITYYKKFNQNMLGQAYGVADFDYLDNSGCNFNINPLKQQNNAGAANYYSKYNGNKQQFNAFIPEANGYPFTRVTYMPDPTNRVVRQGNVGEIFQPGNTALNGTTNYQKHDTRYYYGQPEQQKLDYLFGTNVGYAEYYQKNLVVDPNGQTSVSYVDLDGKTIATALAGNAPAGLDALRSNNTLPISVALLTSADVIDEQAHSLTSSQSFVVAANATKYNFSYTLNENTYQALVCANGNYCLDCIYDLEITLVNDECGKIEYQNKQTIGKLTNLNFLCNDANASSNLLFDATLNTGSYTITRKLIVNKQAAEFYADSVVSDPNNKCLKPFADFYNEAWNNRDTMRCKDACTSCKQEADASEEAGLIADAVRSCDSLWCKPQLTTLCDVARMSMINDVTPGGQYAIFKNGNGAVDINASVISIFSTDLTLGIKRIINNPGISNISVDLPGEPTRSLGYYLADNATQLFNNWPDDLSEKLLPLHPEYCYLKFCGEQYVQQSNDFDTRYMNAATFADAQTEFGSWVSAGNINSFYTHDPLYTGVPPTNIGLPASLQIQMQARFSNYTGANNSIIQLALFLADCPSGNTINACSGVWGDGINDDEEWEKFKSIYFSIKQEFLQKAREYYVVNAANCCPNGYIGCKDGDCNVPFVWHTNPIIPNPFISCFSNFNIPIISILYKDAQKRFVTINDIDFPGLPTPTTSIYDMNTADLTNYVASDSIQSPCPTCPEMDAFKMMIWQMSNKKWLTNNITVKADTLIGLKNALRQRLVGSQTNENISIAHNGNGISIVAKNCTISFTADTTINWEKADILPTCLEITDYRHAKLHVMVDGTYKTVLNFTSTCDIFYCDGKAPAPPVVNNDCKCDSVYNNTKWYNLGDVVNYKGQCYIAIKVMKNGKSSPETPPGTKGWWQKLCDIKTAGNCVNPFLIDFETPTNYTIALASTSGNIVANTYKVSHAFNQDGININFSSNVFIAQPRINNSVSIKTQAAIQPGKKYRVSYDVMLVKKAGGDDVISTSLNINNTQVLLTGFLTNLATWLPVNYIFNNTGGACTIDVSITVPINGYNIIAIDNFKMDCIGSADAASPNLSAITTCGSASGTGNTSTDTSRSRYIPQNVCNCNSFCDAPLPSPELPFISCDSILKEIATQQASEAYANYKDSVYNAILSGYYAKCLQSLETFNMTYEDAEYHYTLYYYDQSGNLVQTVPPAGVKPLGTSQLASVQANRSANNNIQVLPAHIMKTNYRHNSLNAVAWQQTPDAGTSEFYYDALGRIALSQNAKQNPLHTASYTTYDNLGRTVEIGSIDVNGITNLKNTAYNYTSWTNFVNSKARTEITKTWYDKPVKPKINNGFGIAGQTNLRNRIATVAIFDDNNSLTTFETDADLGNIQYSHATHYNYDIAGNVTELLQDFGKFTPFGFDPNNVTLQSKHIVYKFDLISGKVNEVHYQPGFPDQFFYKYQYNADNKLTNVFTSTNGMVWENDARYAYYRHGPLARTTLGKDNVQGIDVAYTLQGWIKGANGYATQPNQDIGQDGTNSNNTTIGYQSQNRNVAPDVFSYWLGYNKQDYAPVAGNTAYLSNVLQPLTTGGYHNNPNELFNANIRSMFTYLQPFTQIMGMQFQYDQLNRIKKQEAFDVDNGAAMGNNYSMQLDYDPNGNIQILKRFGGIRIPNAMDDLQYYYYNSNGSTYVGDPTTANATNKLAYVKDAVNAANYTEDIDGQMPNNYTYDAVGNLIGDVSEGITHTDWNLQNKIYRIQKSNGTQIGYWYDALGNRTQKMVNSNSNPQLNKFELYVRDAQGNTLAIYKRNTDSTCIKEQQLYGSSRLGIQNQEVYTAGNYFPIGKTPIINILHPGANIPMRPYPIESYRNTTQYELTNHLGNVLATISDSRTSANTATLLTATDYYAFGMAMPDRKFIDKDYRFGFNGKENDEETETQDYGFRNYNPALGRFLSVDPICRKFPHYSPFHFAGNRPITALDMDGREDISYMYKQNKEGKGFTFIGKMDYREVNDANASSGIRVILITNKGEIIIQTMYTTKFNTETPSLGNKIGYFLDEIGAGKLDKQLTGNSRADNDSYQGVDGMYKGAKVLNKTGDFFLATEVLAPLGVGLNSMATGLEVVADYNKGKLNTAGAKGLTAIGGYVVGKVTEKVLEKVGVKNEEVKEAIGEAVDYLTGKATDAIVDEAEKKDKKISVKKKGS